MKMAALSLKNALVPTPTVAPTARKLDDNPYKKISTYTEEDADQSETIIINNQSSSSSSSEDKSTSGDTVLAMQGAFTDTTDGKEFVGGNSAYDILHKGA